MRDRRLLLYIALVVILALMAVGTMHILWPHFLWQNENLHCIIETVGAVAAILMAIVLLQRQPDEGGRRLFWVALGLLGAGILDGFHAASQPGQGFVLLHSTAVLVGGFGFALVWLPETYQSTFVRRWIPWAVIIGAALFGIWTLLFSNTLPAMVQDGQFTNTARVMNLLSGVFFIAAAGRFLLDFYRSFRLELYLFTCMALLFGVASLSFTYSALWDDVWWFWHVVRLLAYLLVMGFVVRGYLQTASSLRAEIIERKRNEEHIRNLNKVLSALRGVNQLITKEKDRKRLIQQSCNLMIQTRGFLCVWILLFDEKRKFVSAVVAGGEEMQAFYEQLEQGNYPLCIDRILAHKDSLAVCDEIVENWLDCLPRGYYSDGRGLISRLEYEGKVYGIVSVYVPSDYALDPEEQDLFRELAGDIAYALASIEKEEQRKQAEEELRKSEEKYRDLVDNALVGVYRTNLKGDILYINEALVRMLGFDSREEIIASGALVRYKNRKDREVLIEKLKKEGKVSNFEFEVLTKTGETKNVLLSATLRGDVLSGMLRDITEQKQAEAKLIITDRLASVGEMASGVAHELNNPLTSVIGFSELLLEEDLPDKVREDVEVINREAQRTAQVVKNLLTFARKHKPSKQPVNINDIIEKVLELRAYEHRGHNIQVIKRFAPDLAEVMADYFQLQQVFLNIIINAEYFMIEAHSRGTLVITTERAGSIIRASFADDGLGIAQENIGHVFDPFFTTKEVGKGTGLGLSICHGIATEHGGGIYAQSELGRGATFIVELPNVSLTTVFSPLGENGLGRNGLPLCSRKFWVSSAITSPVVNITPFTSSGCFSLIN